MIRPKMFTFMLFYEHADFINDIIFLPYYNSSVLSVFYFRAYFGLI